MFAYIVDQRLMALNGGDMTGNSDWQEIATTLTPDDRLQDDHGAALYKIVKGKVKERTEAERKADWPPEPTPEPSTAEKIAFLEECLMEMSEEVYK